MTRPRSDPPSPSSRLTALLFFIALAPVAWLIVPAAGPWLTLAVPDLVQVVPGAPAVLDHGHVRADDQTRHRVSRLHLIAAAAVLAGLVRPQPRRAVLAGRLLRISPRWAAAVDRAPPRLA